MSDRVRSAAHFSVLGAMLVLSLGTASRVEGARPSPWPGDSVRADRAGMSASVESGSLSRLTNALRGLSGKLFARMVLPSLETPAVPAFARLFGDSSLARPGMYPVRPLDRPFS